MLTPPKLFLGLGAIASVSLFNYGTYQIFVGSTIKDWLVKSKLRILNENILDPQDKGFWVKKINEHNSDDPGLELLKLKDLYLSKDSGKEEENIKRLKQRCRFLLETSVVSEEFSKKVVQAKKWCTE